MGIQDDQEITIGKLFACLFLSVFTFFGKRILRKTKTNVLPKSVVAMDVFIAF